MTTPAPPGRDMKLQRSSRDAGVMAHRLEGWLADTLPGSQPQVRLFGASDANGMSSETVMADVAWTEAGRRNNGEFVIRIAPDADDLPVFPEYRLDHQYELLRLVGELTEVPVPEPRWLEPTGEVLGAPFFFMTRVDGEIPPDVLPYPFGDNWLFDATAQQQEQLQRATIETVAALHQIPDPQVRFAFLPDRPGLAGQFARTRNWYEWATTDVGRSHLIDRAFTWLADNLPSTDEAVLLWGDSRIGNMIFQDFTPVAVLDWEMANLGPRACDLAWLAFAHRVFQTIAETFELPGMPHFLRADDVRAEYETITGVDVGDLTWYEVYAATQWGCVFMRTGARQAHFGEIEPPERAEDLFHHGPLFEAMLAEVGA